VNITDSEIGLKINEIHFWYVNCSFYRKSYIKLKCEEANCWWK
jgi:hypothetical protein